MATLSQKEPGVILAGRFDRSSPGVQAELAAFDAELKRLKTRLGFTHFVQAVEQDGPIATVRIFPAKVPPGFAPSPEATPRGWGPR